MDHIALDAVVGWCDGFQHGYVRGWAWYPRQPSRTVTVELVVDGQVVGEAAACIARPDLRSAGIGQGRHAFSIPFSVPAAQLSTLHAVVREKGGPALNDGSFTIEVMPHDQARQTQRGSQTYLEAIFGPFMPTSLPLPQALPAPDRPPVTFILYCAAGGADVAITLGAPDYSYRFAMLGFREVLRRLGTVHVVADPTRDADRIHRACLNRAELCVMLSFAPPHATPLGLAVPTIPVLAWEFGTIPTEVWDGEPRHDWRHVFRQTGRAITHSSHAAGVIAHTMGPAFPVASIPTPVHGRLGPLRNRIAPIPRASRPPIVIDGFVWDSRAIAVGLGMTMPPLPVRPAWPQPPDLRLRDWKMSLATAGVAIAAATQAGHVCAAQAAAAARAAADEATRVLAEAAAVELPEPSRPKTARHRAGLTLRMGRDWYREVVRDALPKPFVVSASAAGRLAWLMRAALQPVVPAIPPLVLAGAPTPAADAPATQPVPPPPPVQQPRWHPANDAPPFPETELAAIFPGPALASLSPAEPRPGVVLDGIVFTATLSPKDGRKNWQDILSAFVMAFLNTPDATLVFKMIGADAGFWWWEFHDIITRLPRHACRVVVLHGYLEDAAFADLIQATHFVTNASLGEGQCLPLTEFMSARRPAIAPDHTAMADYITQANAIIVRGEIEYASWPHDPSGRLTTTRFRMDWSSLRDAFAQAYLIAKDDPDRYRAMGEAAAAAMQAYCGDETVIRALERILYLPAAAEAKPV